MEDALDRASAERSPHRFYGRLREEDLERLLELEREWRASLERRKEHWRLYAYRLLAICLGQGGALHMLNGKNGIKDLDIYRFFAAHPSRPHPDPAIYRGKTHVDFGPSRFGKRTDPKGVARFGRFAGRNVDIFSVALPVEPGADPIPAIRALLNKPRTDKERALATKALIVIDPKPLQVVWPLDADGARLLGYES